MAAEIGLEEAARHGFFRFACHKVQDVSRGPYPDRFVQAELGHIFTILTMDPEELKVRVGTAAYCWFTGWAWSQYVSHEARKSSAQEPLRSLSHPVPGFQELMMNQELTYTPELAEAFRQVQDRELTVGEVEAAVLPREPQEVSVEVPTQFLDPSNWQNVSYELPRAEELERILFEIAASIKGCTSREAIIEMEKTRGAIQFLLDYRGAIVRGLMIADQLLAAQARKNRGDHEG